MQFIITRNDVMDRINDSSLITPNAIVTIISLACPAKRMWIIFVWKLQLKIQKFINPWSPTFIDYIVRTTGCFSFVSRRRGKSRASGVANDGKAVFHSLFPLAPASPFRLASAVDSIRKSKLRRDSTLSYPPTCRWKTEQRNLDAC